MLKCYEIIDERKKEEIFNTFYEHFNWKDEHNPYLSGLISIQPIMNRHPYVEVRIVTKSGEIEATDGIALNFASFRYKVRYKEDIEICLTSFF